MRVALINVCLSAVSLHEVTNTGTWNWLLLEFVIINHRWTTFVWFTVRSGRFRYLSLVRMGCTRLRIGVTWLIALGGDRPWVVRILLCSVSLKTRVFIVFQSSHNENNRFENFYLFYLPLFNSVDKKFLRQKIYCGGGIFTSPPPKKNCAYAST